MTSETRVVRTTQTPTQNLEAFDVVVVGSGLAGLSCARALSRQGARVAVVEKATKLGGHLLPFDRGGVTFEVGIHYIADVGQGSPFQEACEDLGVAFRYVALDEAFEELRFPEGKRAFYRGGFSTFIEELKTRFPPNLAGLARYEKIVDLAWELSRRIRFPARSRDLAAIVLREPRFLKLVPLLGLSLEAALRERFGFGSELAEILSAQHVLMGVRPREASALLHFVVHRYYFEDACFVEGGGREMIRQLLNDDVRYFAGVDIGLRRESDGTFRVEGTRAGHANGDSVRINLSARRVVWTPDPRLLADAAPSLAATLPALSRMRLQASRDPHGLTVAYFATRAPLEELGLPNRNVWLMGSLSADASYDEEDPVRLAAEAPVYISTGSLRDPHACPLGNPMGARGVFQAMFLCPGNARAWNVDAYETYRVPESKGGQGRAYRLKKGEVLATLAARIEKEFPGLAENLAWKELGTPLTHRRYLHSVSGSGYGFAATVADFLWSRPSHESGIDGLHFCGAHVKPAHGIVTALVNGVGLARRIASWDNAKIHARRASPSGGKCGASLSGTTFETAERPL